MSNIIFRLGPSIFVIDKEEKCVYCSQRSGKYLRINPIKRVSAVCPESEFDSAFDNGTIAATTAAEVDNALSRVFGESVNSQSIERFAF